MQLSFSESVTLALRELYDRYGYTQYKMSKFEEYDLYARNKDFLISDSVITFTDTTGKLMALKPDVTLSIVKNSKDDPQTVQKVYYTENVYRVSKGSRSFKEIMQVGLERLGAIDDYGICEVLSLAAHSLRSISPACVLEVSHVGLLSDVADRIGVPADRKAALFKCIGEKNAHEMQAICEAAGVTADDFAMLKQVVFTTGTPRDVLPALAALLPQAEAFVHIVSAVENSDIGDMLRIDFSVVDDIHYYNGIVFKGFIDGIPTGILSGGQYDKLMRKMNRQSGAIGFAVYTDLLERLDTTVREFDTDTVLVYGEQDSPAAIRQAVEELTRQGNRVTALRTVPADLRYKQLITLGVRHA